MLRNRLIAALLCCGLGVSAAAEPLPDASRGELLYTKHCRACHSARLHWREQKKAGDWTGLQSEVRRWAEFSGLHYRDDEVAVVARYLNDLYYHYPTGN